MTDAAHRLRAGLRTPYRLVQQHRHPDIDPVARAMLDAQGWRRSMFDFMAATLDDPHILHDADLDPTSVVVDAGAHVGGWAAAVAERHGCRVHAFEPDPTAWPHLVDAARRDPRLVPHRQALGSADGRLALALDGPGSALRPGAGAFGQVDVEVRDVAGALDELGVDEVDLLKLNIEGGEFDVLDRLAATGWLPRIRQVSVQFHEWIPGAHRRRRRNRRALGRTHDEQWCYPWVWELWRRR